MSTAQRVSESRMMLLIILVLMLFGMGSFAYVVVSSINETACIHRWADRRTARDERVIGYNKAVIDAQSNYLTKQQAVFAITNTVPFDVVKFHAALDQETHAYDDYQAALKAQAQALKDNPIPPAPEFSC